MYKLYTLFAYSILISFILLIVSSCDEVGLYDESVIVNEIRNNEDQDSLISQDITVTYITSISSGLASNSLRFKVDLSPNVDLSPIIDLGLVYNDTGEPSLLDSKTASSNIESVNIIDVDQLLDGQTYYFKAYMITDQGIFYSSDELTLTVPDSESDSDPEVIFENDFSSLNDIESLIYPYAGYESEEWGITTSNCIAPPCITTGQSHGGYVMFNIDNPANGYFEFWFNTFDPGYSNRMPVIKINGIETTEIEVIDGQTSSFKFMKLRVNNVNAGNINIKIHFEEFTNRIITYTIDEFKLYNN